MKLLTIIALFFQPIYGIFFTLGAFVMADFITGVMAAKRRGETITSKKMGHSITKTIVYMLAVVVTHAADTYIIFPGIGMRIIYIVAGWILLDELTSLDENLKCITGKSIFKTAIGFLNKKGLNSDQ